MSLITTKTVPEPPAGEGPEWCLYMLECGDGTIYCGVSNNLERRLRDHATVRGSRYVRAHGGIRKLLRAIPMGTKTHAMRAEYRIKRSTRALKLAVAAGGSIPEIWFRRPTEALSQDP